MVLGLGFALVAFLADQFSKQQMLHFFENHTSPVEVFSGFDLVEAWNTGVSFSMFNDGGLWGTVLLSVFSAVIVSCLIYWLYQEQSRLVQVSLGMIIGGALGNLADRIRFGAVYDFLDFYYHTYHWPAFNVADALICFGAFLIICHTVFTKSKQIQKEISK